MVLQTNWWTPHISQLGFWSEYDSKKVLLQKSLPKILTYLFHDFLKSVLFIVLCRMVTSSKPTFTQTLLSLCKCNFTQTWSAKGKTQRVHTTNWQCCQLMPWFLESLWGMAAPVPWSFTALLRLAVPTGVSSTHGVIIDGLPRLLRPSSHALTMHMHPQKRTHT